MNLCVVTPRPDGCDGTIKFPYFDVWVPGPPAHPQEWNAKHYQARRIWGELMLYGKLSLLEFGDDVIQGLVWRQGWG